MALRIKSRWHDEDSERSLEEIAGALAFISWRIAKDKAINLHGEDFVYETDEQRMAVIVEYLIFQLQIVDRIAHQLLGLNEKERRQLVITLAKHLAGHLQDNSVDLFGPGDYVKPFIEKMNQRGTEYAEFSYGTDGPSYPFMRHLRDPADHGRDPGQPLGDRPGHGQGRAGCGSRDTARGREPVRLKFG